MNVCETNSVFYVEFIKNWMKLHKMKLQQFPIIVTNNVIFCVALYTNYEEYFNHILLVIFFLKMAKKINFT